jgi:hypothetical protein
MKSYRLINRDETIFDVTIPAGTAKLTGIARHWPNATPSDSYKRVGGEFVVRRRSGARTGPDSAAANRSDPQILDPGSTDAVAGTLADLRHDRGVIE